MWKNGTLSSMTKESEVRPSSPITGFVDYTPDEQYLFACFLKKIVSSYEIFGFTPLHLRPFERLSALKGEGETQKQIFEVFRADTGETTSLGLPFDHTVPLALWVAEHAGHLQHLPLPYKRYDVGLSFRGERPKTGRLRAFIQADIDIVGRKLNLSADAECLSAALTALSSLNIGSFHVHINHIGVVQSLLDKYRVPQLKRPALLRCIDKLDKLSANEVIAEILKIEDLGLSQNQVEDLLKTLTTQSSLDDLSLYGPTAEQPLSELRTFLSLLEKSGFDRSLFSFSPHMVRGLAYYTGIVFETVFVGKEEYGSVASGGRYANLVSDFAPNLTDVEGVGLSIGLTRIIDILTKTGFCIPQKKTTAELLVAARLETLMPKAYEVASALRKQGWKVDVYSGLPKVKSALSHAAAIGVEHTVLVMDEQALVVKEMASQTQHEWPDIESVVSFLKK